jgi:SET domain-containing protein
MNSATLKKVRRIVVRRSGIHGKGVFATAHILGGTRLIEYKGERMSGEECEGLDTESTHTFLFMLDNSEVIDGGRNGNTARWINHSCYPNCEANEEDGRVFIDALRHIVAGEEITIDYNLYLEARYTAALKREYACGCGMLQCRGTLLASKR